MKKETIGAHAGIVWRMLSAKHNRMTFSELLVSTQLNPVELAYAIGWLARENKIHFSEEEGQKYFSVYNECYY